MTLTSSPERAAPHDREAERQVLGSLLIDRDAIFKVADALAPEDFFFPAHARTYAAVLALLERHEKIDALTVQLELDRRGELDRIGGSSFVKELADSVRISVEVDRFARAVTERSLLRGLLDAARIVAAEAYDEPTDVMMTLDRAEQRIFSLRDRSRTAKLRHIRVGLRQHWEDLTDRVDHPLEMRGVESGFPDIDKFSDGLTRGDLFVIGARPAVGKTSLALAMAEHTARKGAGVLFFSLEMDLRQLVTRLIALVSTGSDLLRLRLSGAVDTDAADRLRRLPIAIDDTAGLSVMELRAKARRVMAQQEVRVIFVDYLQLVRTGSSYDNRVQEVAAVSRSLKALARELNVSVVALAQLSRATADVGHQPRLSSLRESGALEQDADVVLLLWRDQEEIGSGPRLIKGVVAKNRNGATGPFELFFESERARFFSKARETIPT